MNEGLAIIICGIPAVIIFWLGMKVGVWAYKENIKMGREEPPKINFD